MASRFKSYLPLIVIGILALAFFVGAISMLIFNLQPVLVTSSPSKTPAMIILYEGEMSDGEPGFGTSADNLTSPGPTIGFSTSDTVNITVINVGKQPHAFEITTIPAANGPVLFGAMIGSGTSPIQPGKEGSIVFTPNNGAFDYWYISPVGNDATDGMYGAVIVSSVTGPAFP